MFRGLNLKRNVSDYVASESKTVDYEKKILDPCMICMYSPQISCTPGIGSYFYTSSKEDFVVKKEHFYKNWFMNTFLRALSSPLSTGPLQNMNIFIIQNFRSECIEPSPLTGSYIFRLEFLHFFYM